MHPPSVSLANLSVKFSKMFLNLARYLKLTQSLNIGLHWDRNQLRRTRSHSTGIGHQLFTAAQGHSGDWITTYPIAQVGTRLDDETLRISVALRVGLNVGLAHQCRCGITVQSAGLHPLSCRLCAGRFIQHAAISNIIKISLDTAGLHSIVEPVGLGRRDGRRPDELPNRCRPLRGWKTRPEKERRGRPNRHHSIPAPRERGLIQPFFR